MDCALRATEKAQPLPWHMPRGRSLARCIEDNDDVVSVSVESIWRSTGAIWHTLAAKSVVSYIRVSTARQGRSGLGLEAQREAIARFAREQGFTVAAEFVEVETGKGSDPLDRRPKLAVIRPRAQQSRRPIPPRTKAAGSGGLPVRWITGKRDLSGRT
jgi:hypothetical protein